jgi:MYXO-CTERM domain-containing protein
MFTTQLNNPNLGSGWGISGGTFTGEVIAPNPNAPVVPEPTTATLSLLALAGLAARRRRK